MRRIALIMTIGIAVTAVPVIGFQGPPGPLSEYWFDDDEWHLDVQYIISAEELASYQQSKTTDQRDAFISQFWSRRDPTPGTPENEFRDEYYRRIEYAKAHFANASDPAHSGLDTDRGRIYAMFGAPDKVDYWPTSFYEIWHYTTALDPASRFTFEFSVPPISSCDASYRVISPRAMASFPASAEHASSTGRFTDPSVDVYPRGFVTARIPLDFSKTANVRWSFLARNGDPVREKDAELQGSFGTTKKDDPLTNHLLGCRLFGPGGMGYTYSFTPGSYSFASEVTLTNGDVQKDVITFEVR